MAPFLKKFTLYYGRHYQKTTFIWLFHNTVMHIIDSLELNFLSTLLSSWRQWCAEKVSIREAHGRDEEPGPGLVSSATLLQASPWYPQCLTYLNQKVSCVEEKDLQKLLRKPGLDEGKTAKCGMRWPPLVHATPCHNTYNSHWLNSFLELVGLVSRYGNMKHEVPWTRVVEPGS